MRPPLGTLPDRYRRARARREERRDRALQPRLAFDPSAPQLLLSPHLDDAVLDRWALLDGDADVRVVNLFAGVPPAGTLAPWDAITGASDSAARVRERLAEDADALALAGRDAVNLPFLDAQYRPPPPAPGLAEIDAAVSAALASAARVHVPAGIGAHADHLLARRYGLALARAGMPVSLYAELPYCVLHGWPSWVDGREPDPLRDVDVFWRSFLGGVSKLGALRSAAVERLDDESAAAKLRAMLCYRTQLPALDYGARGMLRDPEVYRYEVVWELRGAA